MELGRFIAKQLKADDGVDTLGRWMAHYLAEQLEAASKATGTKKDKLERDVSDLILRIWAQRHSLPGNVSPLASYEKAANVLAAIRSGAGAFAPWRTPPASRTASLALECFDLASKLALLGLFDLIPQQATEVPEPVEKFLRADEGLFLCNIQDAYSALAACFPEIEQPRSPAVSDGEDFRDARSKLVQRLQEKLTELAGGDAAPSLNSASLKSRDRS